MNPMESPNAINPGSPALMQRMIDECSAGEKLGVHFNEAITDESVALYERGDDYPFWVISANPVVAMRLMAHYPNTQQVWFVSQEQYDKLQAERPDA